MGTLTARCRACRERRTFLTSAAAVLRRAAERAREQGERTSWRDSARNEQRAPEGKWRTWYVRGGRGGGKTWTGSNNFAELITSSEPGEWGVVAPTYGDARDTCIESSESGLIKALGGRCVAGVLVEAGPHISAWNRSMGQLFLTNGSVVYVDGADDGALRIQGKNLRGAWCDEVGLWKQWATAWNESIRYAVRLAPARIIATGTPKRNMPARKLVKQLLEDDRVPKSLLRTVDNAPNLDEATLAEYMEMAGTTLGRQELEGELLEEVEGALWRADLILHVDTAPELERVVIAVDPAGTSHASSDETGIIAAGRDSERHGFVLADYSGRFSPDGWGKRVCLAYVEHEADAIVFERNMGWDLGPHIIRSSWTELVREGVVDGLVPRIIPVSAARGKQTRAEPVVAQYEQGRWHHVGSFPVLEDQMCAWVPGEPGSPDRVDALVWAAFGLTVQRARRSGLVSRPVDPNTGLPPMQRSPDNPWDVQVVEQTPPRKRGMKVRF